MIAPLRLRHRRMIAALAVALPLGWLAALAGRAPEPTLEALPSEATEPDRRPGRDPDFESAELFGHQPLTLRCWSESDGSIMSLEAHAPLSAPDLLLYLGSTPAEIGAPLPGDVRLLGPVPGHGERSFVLPPTRSGTQLLIYSLAWQRVVDRAELPAPTRTAEVGR